MTKLFARKVLDLSHFMTFTFIVGNICNKSRFRKSNIMSHGSLGKQTLFYSRKFTKTCIKRWNKTHIQQSTYDRLKLETKFHVKLIILTNVIDFLNN